VVRPGLHRTGLAGHRARVGSQDGWFDVRWPGLRIFKQIPTEKRVGNKLEDHDGLVPTRDARRGRGRVHEKGHECQSEITPRAVNFMGGRREAI
jgi:hypothetical protein